jgi:hypothetical protein
MSKQIIICRYNEDVDWVNQLTCDYLIYNKSDVKLDNPNIINLNNHFSGRESHTMIYHLYHNYDNLADETIFLQGNPFDHYDKPVDTINKISSNLFYPLGVIEKYIGMENTSQDKLYNFLFNKPCPESLIFVRGSQFYISKQCIHLHSRTFYKKCWETFLKKWDDKILDTKLGYIYESLWFYIFLPENLFLQKQYIKEYINIICQNKL